MNPRYFARFGPSELRAGCRTISASDLELKCLRKYRVDFRMSPFDCFIGLLPCRGDYMKVLTLVFALALAPPSVLAQTAQNHNSCNAGDDTPEVAVISDCTHLLDSGKPDQRERATIYYCRGAAHWRNGDFDAAIIDENEAIKIDPGFADAYMRRGAAYLGKGDYDRAIAEVDVCILEQCGLRLPRFMSKHLSPRPYLLGSVRAGSSVAEFKLRQV